jgi:uncharacterized coiled-coil DUF342 family protein
MERRGHAVPGMDAVYVHPTPEMRQQLCDHLQQLWQQGKLTHKLDLKDLFYVEVKAHDGIPVREIKLHEQIIALKNRIETLRQERDDYRTATETFARAINALTVENDTLRKELDKSRSSRVPVLSGIGA